jgi:hypothetical protein
MDTDECDSRPLWHDGSSVTLAADAGLSFVVVASKKVHHLRTIAIGGGLVSPSKNRLEKGGRRNQCTSPNSLNGTTKAGWETPSQRETLAVAKEAEYATRRLIRNDA